MKNRLLLVLLCLGLVFGLCPFPRANAQTGHQAEIEGIMQVMSPEEKVGQLFLVSFEGTNLAETSDIYDLIFNYHVGGVVLSAENDNFTEENTVTAAWELIQQLQEINRDAQQSEQIGPQNLPADYVPMFVGMSLVRGDNRTSQISNGMTEFPSPMSIGATWSTDLAKEVGIGIGKELSALGVNLFLGPALDVVDSKDTVAANYANTQSFGGDPYWVGELGKAYVQGIHQGSNGAISVIAQHFPGLGNVDRPPDEEVSTVQKTLDQLEQIELAPYISLTGDPDPERQVDGLMISPVRFQGLQGNIRATTMPINFDQTALEQLLSPESLASWRENGGLTISDSLGSQSVRQFFGTNEKEFDPLSIARTAFLAGNDILFLDNFKARNDEDASTTIRKVASFFTQKYQEDALFAQRVDESVARILNAKLNIYQKFDIAKVFGSKDSLSVLGTGSALNLKVNRQAASLIYPSADYLNIVLPQPPVLQDNITVFTDTRHSQQCSTCAQGSEFGNMDFETTLVRYYGGMGTNQLNSERIHNYSFLQLSEILDQRTEPSDPYLSDNLKRSQWVVFNILNESEDMPETRALKRILSERPDLLRNKKVIVFSYAEPYYLDSTDLANVTAYYALYNKNQAALDIAARLLMREMSANGSLPVSLSAVDYQVRMVTSPDPEQVIQVNLISPDVPTTIYTTETALAETPMPLFVLGENVRIQAGPIVDQNGNRVPDGTVVRFTVRLASENLIVSQPEATTVNGLATIDYRIERDGIFEVTAVSEPALTSGKLILNTQVGLAQVVLPTATATPTATPTLVPTPTQTPQPTAAPDPQGNITGYPKLTDWLLAILLVTLGGLIAWFVGFKWWDSHRWGARSVLFTVIGGLTAYLLLTLGIKPIAALLKQSASWFVAQTTLIGMLFGWAFALAWWVYSQSEHPNDPLKRL